MAKKKIATVHPDGKPSALATKASAQGGKKPYVPEWKKWKESKEGKDYLKYQAPKDKEKMLSLIKQMDDEKNERQRIKERDQEMAKQFQLRWVDAQSGKVQETTHDSEKSAKDRARKLSMDNSPVQVGEVDGGKLLQQWNFDKGRQQEMNTKKQVTVAPISKKEAAQIKTNERTEPMPKATKKGQKEGPKKPEKATKVAPPAKTQPLAKSGGVPAKKTGTIRDQFGLREGSNRAKLVDCLLEAKGKPVAIAALLKAVYGSVKEEGKSAINMVLKGAQDMINKNKIKLEIVRGKDDKGGVTIALKAK